MQFEIPKSALLRALGRTHAVADRKSSLPILSNTLISTEGTGIVRLAATDLYLGVTAVAEASITKGGTVAVSAKTLFEIVRNLPEQPVHWESDSQGVRIQCGKVRYRIPAMPGEDFPPLPNPGKAKFSEIPIELLGELIALTHYSMSTDDTRPHLAGALLQGDGKLLRMVTTDGHRLSKAERKLEEGELLNFSMLIPSKGVQELRRIIDDTKADRGSSKEGAVAAVHVASVSGHAFFRRNGVELSVKLTDEQFPPYDKVIPQQQSRRIVIKRLLLVEALRRISLVASDKSGGVRFQIEPGKMQITSENPDVGEGSEELDVDFAGEPLSIGFNARYLLDALTALTDDEVAFGLSGELDPGAVRPAHDSDRFVGVVMPMRI